jgi:hypothetical protein
LSLNLESENKLTTVKKNLNENGAHETMPGNKNVYFELEAKTA